MIKRRKTRTVTVGGVNIGSRHPVVIQSMAKTETSDVNATVAEISELEKAGCELVRVAVKGEKDAKAISAIKEKIRIPLIADIHFDHHLAMEAMERGVDKIRINPGNITDIDDINKVIDMASGKNIPIRIGVNSGSLGKTNAGVSLSAELMVASLREYLEHFRNKKFHDIVTSLKASDVLTTVEVYRRLADECDYPLHLGVTAAGLPASGVVKSSIGIGALLLDGIGDTIRVSLTGESVDEVDVAKRILASTGTRHFGPEIISCPTCGRCQVALVPIVEKLEKALTQPAQHITQNAKRATRDARRNTPLIVAVMGCEVNGPGEARTADVGIAFGKGKGAIFRNGEIIKTVKEKDAVKELLEIVREMMNSE